eukprot:8488066-Pyramimonas_sp.AAC.1
MYYYFYKVGYLKLYYYTADTTAAYATACDAMRITTHIARQHRYRGSSSHFGSTTTAGNFRARRKGGR